MADAAVLIVGDEELVTEYVSQVLTGAGYSTCKAASGPQALKIIRDGQAPDVVIANFEMPGLRGPVLLESVRRASKIPALLLMSAYAGAQDPPPDIAFIQKPFHPDESLARVENLLARSRQALAALARDVDLSKESRATCRRARRRLTAGGSAF